MTGSESDKPLYDEGAVVDAIITALESCGVSDIEAGIGALLGFGSPEKIAAFRKAIEDALPTFEVRIEGYGDGR